MSTISSSDKVVTQAQLENDLSAFYTTIRPFLNGAAHTGFTPVGTVISVMSNHAPQNYLICDGTVYNIADYPELAEHFETEFGSKNFFGGNGTTTFGVPDLRGEFLRGTGTNSHSNQGKGANVGVHQDGTEIPNNVAYQGYFHIPADSNKTNTANKFDTIFGQVNYRAVDTKSFVSESTETSLRYTSRPTNTSVLYCIATKNIYVDARCDYSTSEKVVGTWVDGKPLYQKTIVLGSEYIPNSEMKTVAHGISSVDEVIDVKGVFLNSTSHVSTDAPRVQDNMTNANISIDVDRTNLYIKGRGADFTSAFTDIYVTIQYTKTTD